MKIIFFFLQNLATFTAVESTSRPSHTCWRVPLYQFQFQSNLAFFLIVHVSDYGYSFSEQHLERIYLSCIQPINRYYDEGLRCLSWIQVGISVIISLRQFDTSEENGVLLERRSGLGKRDGRVGS